jgi:P27 family predicted phage terminase small subunit
MPESTGTRLPSAPRHLSKEARKLWRRLVATYIFDDAQLLILRTALEAFDRLQAARAALNEEGATYLAPSGQLKANPAASVEKDARAGMLSALRMLNLHLEV